MDVVTLGMARADAARRHPLSVDLGRNYVSAGSKARWMNQNTLSNGTDTVLRSRLRQIAPIESTGLVLRYGNAYSAGSTETPGPNAMTLRVSIECQQNFAGSGGFVFWPVFFNGRRDVVMEPGAILDSDLLGIHLAAGQQYYVRTHVTVASGGRWPVNILAIAGDGDRTDQGVGLADHTTTTSGEPAALGANTYTYGPVAIVAPRRTKAPSVALVGDSIPNGTGDDPVADRGFAVRAFNGTVPFVACTFPGSTLENFSHEFPSRMRLLQIQDCSSALWSYGANDLGALRTLAQMQADSIRAWRKLNNSGMTNIRVCTITPRTTSTDSWATTANQTPHSANSTRVAYNDWIRDGAPILNGAAVATGSNAAGTLRAGAVGHPIAGYYETADTVESARNSGLWKVNGSANYATADGLHPSSAGHTLMAAAIDVSKLA